MKRWIAILAVAAFAVGMAPTAGAFPKDPAKKPAVVKTMKGKKAPKKGMKAPMKAAKGKKAPKKAEKGKKTPMKPMMKGKKAPAKKK